MSWQEFEKLGSYEIWRKASGSNGLMNQIASCLRKFCAWAIDNHLLSNPDRFIADLTKCKKLKVKGRRLTQVPKPEEMDALLAQVSSFDKQTGQLCALLAYTGARLEGALGLHWKDIDPVLRWITVTEKGDKTRTVHLHKRAADVLTEIKGQHSGNGERPLKGPVFNFGEDLPDSARGHLHRAAELLDSPIKTPHYFRHWFTTQALLQGVPVRTLAGIIGHADGGALLLKTYRHLCDNAAKEATQSLKF